MTLTERIIRLKVYWTRASTYFAVPFALFNYASLFLLLSRQYGFSGTLVIPFCLFILIAYIGVGWLDVRLRVFAQEQSFGNAHNPEMVALMGGLRK